MAWAYWNPVRIGFGPGQFDKVGEQIAGRPWALVTYGIPHFRALAAQACRRGRRARRHHRQHRHQSGLRRSGGILPPLRRGLAAARSHRRARRRLDDRCRQGTRRKRRRFRPREASPDRARAARSRGVPADHRGADHVRNGQRSHLMGDGLGRDRRREILARPSASLSGSRAGRSRADARGAARTDAGDRTRRAVALARKPVECERQSGLGELRGGSGARNHRHAAAAARPARRSRPAHAARARKPVRGPRLLQHQDRARAQHLLRHHAAPRHGARHRLLVLPAAGDGLGDRRQSRVRRGAQAHLRGRPASGRAAADPVHAQRRRRHANRPITASARTNGTIWWSAPWQASADATSSAA